MSYKKLFMVIVFALLTTVILGCSNEKNDKTSHSNKSKDKVEHTTVSSKESNGQKRQSWVKALKAPKPPVNLSEIVEFPAGKLAELDFDKKADRKKVLKVFKQLPKLGKHASKKKITAYYRKTVSLFYKDYKGPENIINQLKYTSYGNPDIEDPRFHFKDHLNVEIVLDASGSMAAQINGQSKMEIAKDVIKSFADSLPEKARISLRVYGHKGSGSNDDKKLSCNSSKLVYDLKPYEDESFSKALNQFEPSGWTPISLALKHAKKDLSEHPAKTNTNIIFLVSDGIATCGGNPVQVAKSLAKSNINPIVNVIGFDMDHEGKRQLKKVAEAADGVYSDAENQQELAERFNSAQKIAEKWAKWKEGALLDVSHEHFEQTFEILDYSLDFKNKYLNAGDNILYTWRYLRDHGYIYEDHYYVLKDKQRDRIGIMIDLSDQLAKKLQNINDKNYEAIKNSINKIYKQNAGNE